HQDEGEAHARLALVALVAAEIVSEGTRIGDRLEIAGNAQPAGERRQLAQAPLDELRVRQTHRPIEPRSRSGLTLRSGVIRQKVRPEPLPENRSPQPSTESGQL